MNGAGAPTFGAALARPRPSGNMYSARCNSDAFSTCRRAGGAAVSGVLPEGEGARGQGVVLCSIVL